MNPSAQHRLAELFVRYWEDALTPAEAAELDQLLASDPAACDWFQMLVTQAVAAADLRAVERETDTALGHSPDREASAPAGPVPAAPAVAPRWSRRRVLGLVGGGLAAGIGGVALGRWLWPTEGPRPAELDRSVRLGSVRGTVKLCDADGRALPTDGPVPPGSTVATSGPGASVVLFFPNGTNVALTEDSAVTLGPSAEQLRVEKGVVAADVRPPLVGGHPLTLTTDETVLTGQGGAIMTLYQAAAVTEVGVQRGSVNVAAPGGRVLGEVRDGELLTVHAGGDWQKQAIPSTPDSYALDLTRPLASGWTVGRIEREGKQPVLVPEVYADPYYNGRKMYQVRSNKVWARGFFRIEPDSVVRVKYRVKKSGPGQVCFCVRTTDVRSPETGMLEWNGDYGSHAPGRDGWRELAVRADKMLNNKHDPRFRAPWIGFLFIFNTYDADLGLQIGEFRVSPANSLS